MKKFLLLLLALSLLVAPLSSCQNTEQNDTVTIVTTVFPEYDWVMNILGQQTANVEVILLTENGTDLHSFQPTVGDIAKISTCDILICTGGLSDAWIDDALASSSNEQQTVIRLMSLLSHEEKLVEQSQHHNAHAHDSEDHHDSYDEHVWLSLKLAKRFCGAIAEAICQKLPEHAEEYTQNCAAYVAKLDRLDAEYETSVSTAEKHELLFADRFPFTYLTYDYGLSCYAAFPGCSAETEASFETVAFLAETLNKLSLPAVVVLESADLSLAKTVIATSQSQNVRIISLDSLQSVSKLDIQSGISYLDIMKNNLLALESALNHES